MRVLRPFYALGVLVAVLLAPWVLPAPVLAQPLADAFKNFPWGAARRELPVKPERWKRPGDALQHMVSLATLGLIAPDIHTRFFFFVLAGDDCRVGRLRCIGISYGFTRNAEERFVAINAAFSVITPAAEVLANAVSLLGEAYTQPLAGYYLWDHPEFTALLSSNTLFFLRKNLSSPSKATLASPGPSLPGQLPSDSARGGVTSRGSPLQPGPGSAESPRTEGPALRRPIAHAIGKPDSAGEASDQVTTPASTQTQAPPASLRAPVQRSGN